MKLLEKLHRIFQKIFNVNKNNLLYNNIFLLK